MFRYRVRALFLSDLHLGAYAARPRAVLDFLATYDAETIFLVGDVLDLWHGGRVHWSDETQAVMGELARRASAGVRVVYLSGNHDVPLRAAGAVRLPEGWELHEALTHHAADGTRYLVLHGDQADIRLLRFHLMTRIGSRADAALRALDDWLARRISPRPAHRPTRIEQIIATFNSLFVMGGRFERKLAAQARAQGVDGVICGHSHRPALRDVEGTIYANCGDWVDSLTALTEDHDGRLALVQWTEPVAASAPWGVGAGTLAPEA